MSGWLGEVQSGVVGCVKLLGFREDWRRHFDVSATGVARSFIGVVLALPGFAFTAMSINHLAAENPTMVGTDVSISVTEFLLVWVRFWFLFPVVAAITVMVLGAKDRFSSWLVVHNWMVFTSIYFQASLWALYMSGLFNAEALLGIMGIFFMARFLIHWRVAIGSLGLPLAMASAAAAIPLVADMIMQELVA